MCEKSVLDQIAHTQHRPICVSVNPVIVTQPITFRRRFNLKKAEWEGFLADIDSNIEEVDAITENYEWFVEIYVWHRENTYQEGVGQTTFLASQTNQSRYEAYKKQYSIDPFGETTINRQDER